MNLNNHSLANNQRFLQIVLLVASTVLAACLAILSYTQIAQAFSDTEGTPYTESIKFMKDQGVLEDTEGDCEGDNFCPTDPAKRWQVAMWIVRALNIADGQDVVALDAITESSFEDVEVSAEYAPYVEKANELEITTGCGDADGGGKNFCPDDDLTRAQAASFIARAFNLPDATAEHTNQFTDVYAGNAHLDDINKIRSAGITIGCERPTADDLSKVWKFCPEESSKDQILTLIERAIEYKKEGSVSVNVNTTTTTTTTTGSYDDTSVTKTPDLGPADDILMGSLFILGIVASISCVKIYADTRQRQGV